MQFKLPRFVRVLPRSRQRRENWCATGATQQPHKRGAAPASPHQTNQSACKPELHSGWGSRGVGGILILKRCLSQMTWEMPSGPSCQRSLSAGAQGGGGEGCFMLLALVNAPWMKMAVVMQLVREPPPSVVGSAGLSIKPLLMRLWVGLFWNCGQYTPAGFGNVPVLCILFL